MASAAVGPHIEDNSQTAVVCTGVGDGPRPASHHKFLNVTLVMARLWVIAIVAMLISPANAYASVPGLPGFLDLCYAAGVREIWYLKIHLMSSHDE